jgi:ornithine cyclodeaminase/alanine dehydrogenase-like protein (mu-crystallin family)
VSAAHSVPFLDAEAIRARLPWPAVLAALDEALRADVRAPLRASHSIEIPDQPTATLLMMPAWRSGRSIGVKLVTVFPGNANRGKRSVSALYALFDARDGMPLALLDGEELTARRTAGASAYAAARLARRDARTLVMVGAGRIARELIDAHRSIRSLDGISVWSRTAAHAEATVEQCAREAIPARACTDLEAAVAAADIVSCATLSTAPLVLGRWLKPGVHVDLVGAFKKDMRETDDAALQRADIIAVDDRTAALAEGGDIVQAIASGAIEARRIAAELRDFARGTHPGRTSDEQITAFKSVGFALEDLATAEAALRAERSASGGAQ